MAATRQLRSNFEPGTSRWATRRAQWRALGLTDEDMEKPKIAIVNSSSSLAICFSHLDEIARRAKRAIERAGGVAFEVRTAAPSDFITSAGHRGGYILSARDLIPNDIEVAVEGALLDGMLSLASCDKTAPRQLMAAGRLNIPTVIVACGYQPSGSHRGRHCDIEDVFLAAGHLASGQLTLPELTEMSENAVLGPGVCAGLGTANTMHVACEALGMALPGSTPVRANSAPMWDAVERAAERIVEMVDDDLRPRDILTPEAFANAVMTILSVSGSINSVKHLQAVAAEAGCPVDVYALFERLADQVPLLAAVRPNGEHSIEEFEDAGGARGVMKQLEPMLHTGALTLTGRTVGENLSGVTVADEDVIRPAGRALGRRPTIVLVRGSLAPGGGIVKLAVADDRELEFAGPALVYDSPAAALAAVRDGQIHGGEVVVLRGQGPTGSPGMGMASQLVFALDGAGLTTHVAVVTDGQLSGLVNKGIVVGEVSPEAAAGGPLALVRDGDPIRVDVLGRVVDLDVPAAELQRRRAGLSAPPRSDERGWLSIYQRLVRPLPEGAVLSAPETAGSGPADRGPGTAPR
ncbi:MAG TPA: dihydroxy-acid dehydratase [Streptosporangiaceae bacterium]|nr:dihydroxy-acid dehydratase [Streptosporangiaceae bacterium]